MKSKTKEALKLFKSVAVIVIILAIVMAVMGAYAAWKPAPPKAPAEQDSPTAGSNSGFDLKPIFKP
ncbi:MAG TPA: hypothetical protein VG694_02645 [Candidatus Paceibacterota bacterium]|jgi:hypothetical protein|nr:hypothetical protein [Candidatus Paceibacterota bacterium]